MNLDAMAQCVAVHPGGGHHRLYPVRGGDGRLIGALRRSVLEAVPAAERRHVRVIDVVEPMRDVPVVAFDAQVDAVVASHPEAFGLGVFVAGPDGATVGVLGPDELLAAPQRRAGVGAR